MTGIVHSLVGAAAGSLTRSKKLAFAAGVITHLITDIIPHRDIDPCLDVPVAALILSSIGAYYGKDSPEFWGAIGGTIPDLEHGLDEIGKGCKLFPTHINDGKYHGRVTSTKLTQLITGGTALLILMCRKRR